MRTCTTAPTSLLRMGASMMAFTASVTYCVVNNDGCLLLLASRVARCARRGEDVAVMNLCLLQLGDVFNEGLPGVLVDQSKPLDQRGIPLDAGVQVSQCMIICAAYTDS